MEVEKERWAKLLEAAQDELLELLEKRQRLEWEIHQLQTDISHLAGLCGVAVDEPVKQLGLTDAVRYVIASSSTPLTATAIRDALVAKYCDEREYSNLGASIHTILRRLLKARQIDHTSTPNGTGFVWIGVLPPIPPPPSWARERMKILKNGDSG